MKINIEKITIEIDDEHVRTVLLSVLPKLGIKDVDVTTITDNEAEIEATRQLEAIDEVEHDLEEKVDQMEHDIDRCLHGMQSASQVNKESEEEVTDDLEDDLPEEPPSPPRTEVTLNETPPAVLPTTSQVPPPITSQVQTYTPYCKQKKKCINCGAEFVSIHKEVKFCSKKCSAQYRCRKKEFAIPDTTMMVGYCQLCGKQFITSKAERQFCSTSHSTLYRQFLKIHERTGISQKDFLEAYNIKYHTYTDGGKK